MDEDRPCNRRSAIQHCKMLDDDALDYNALSDGNRASREWARSVQAFSLSSGSSAISSSLLTDFSSTVAISSR
jgi:hypothetical protein